MEPDSHLRQRCLPPQQEDKLRLLGEAGSGTASSTTASVATASALCSRRCEFAPASERRELRSRLCLLLRFQLGDAALCLLCLLCLPLLLLLQLLHLSAGSNCRLSSSSRHRSGGDQGLLEGGGGGGAAAQEGIGQRRLLLLLLLLQLR